MDVILGRLAVLALGGVALVGALAGGVARLGWELQRPRLSSRFTARSWWLDSSAWSIGLERAVALGRRWTYVAPLASGLGVLLLMVGAPGGAWLMMLGSAVMVLAFVEIPRAPGGALHRDHGAGRRLLVDRPDPLACRRAGASCRLLVGELSRADDRR